MIRLLKTIRVAALVATAALGYLQPVSAHSAFTWVEEGSRCSGKEDDQFCDDVCEGWNYPGITCSYGECNTDFYTCYCDCVPSN
jgi:hypothetical protein